MNNDYPQHLRINGRKLLSTENFQPHDKLYRGFGINDLSDNNSINVETIRFPDFSCNWGRYSYPEDVRIRKNGKSTDGCYSFNVKTSRYKKIATPVHDPIKDFEYENYSHVEVRELYGNEDILYEPPKYRKKKSSKKRRLEYRKNLSLNATIELEALD